MAASVGFEKCPQACSVDADYAQMRMSLAKLCGRLTVVSNGVRERLWPADRLSFTVRLTRSCQHGFTLIELLAILMLLAVLAAVALPRFVDLSSAARVGAVQQLGGAVQSAAQQWRMACATTSGCPMSSGVFKLSKGSRTVQMWNGWPDSGDTVGNSEIDTVVDTKGFSVAVSDGQITRWTLIDAPSPSDCSVSYREALAANGEPKVDVRTNGC